MFTMREPGRLSLRGMPGISLNELIIAVYAFILMKIINTASIHLN